MAFGILAHVMCLLHVTRKTPAYTTADNHVIMNKVGDSSPEDKMKPPNLNDQGKSQELSCETYDEDWKTVGRILDRFVFFLYLIIILIVTAIILLNLIH